MQRGRRAPLDRFSRHGHIVETGNDRTAAFLVSPDISAAAEIGRQRVPLAALIGQGTAPKRAQLSELCRKTGRARCRACVPALWASERTISFAEAEYGGVQRGACRKNHMVAVKRLEIDLKVGAAQKSEQRVTRAIRAVRRCESGDTVCDVCWSLWQDAPGWYPPHCLRKGRGDFG
jgi:hypothetical protein